MDVDLEICRSDMGDGGWSLHLPGDDRVLLDGPSDPDPDGNWLRPDALDFAAARALVEASEPCSSCGAPSGVARNDAVAKWYLCAACATNPDLPRKFRHHD